MTTAQTDPAARKRIFGWFFFDWASQPYNTLLLTFIFGPYVASITGDGAEAQALWGFWIGLAGIVIALLAPILGAIADEGGGRIRWIAVFSVLYVIGAGAVWFALPDGGNLRLVMVLFAVGLIGMEFATIFTNAMLPDLASRDDIGRLSGNGWAFGYIGGLIALIAILLLFAESPETGKTLIGIDPILGLDAATREGTRAVGPLTAVWYALFMVPFFLWVREPRAARPARLSDISRGLKDLGATLNTLPKRRSLFAYLVSSMLYRDGLNGCYIMGGIFTAGVLGWGIPETGTFGILAIIAGALFAWLGGKWDAKRGPKPVIVAGVLALMATMLAAVFITRDHVFGMPVAEGSKLPDIAFYIIGIAIGAAGGTLQAASRTMMVRQADPERMTEAFGLYALSGKATSFLAPLSIAAATALTGSQQLGILPLIVLFTAGLILLLWVHPDPDPERF